MNISTSIPPRLASLVLIALIVAVPATAFAGDYVVIVNKSSTVAVDKATVAKIYQGDVKSWPDGTPAAAVDLPEDNPVRAAFTTDVLGKSVSNVKALWAQLVFSGKALPPKIVASDDEVKKAVSSAKGGVGYIKSSDVDDSVKVAIK